MMGRLFLLLLTLLMLCAPARSAGYAQPVFFSMLFPQLVLDWDWTAGEAVAL